MGLMMLGKLHTYQQLLPYSSATLRLVLKSWKSKNCQVLIKFQQLIQADCKMLVQDSW